MDTQRPEKSKVSINPQLLLFAPTTINSGIVQTKWVECNPINQLTDDGDVIINISGSGSSYIDLSRSMLYVKAKVVKADGTDTQSADKVAPVNFFLHSLFSQLDIDFQQRQVSTSGQNYPYQSIIDAYLHYGKDAKYSHLQSALYFKDDNDGMEAVDPSPASSDLSAVTNSGLEKRYNFTKNSAEVDMIGVPFSHIFELEKYLINGVEVRVRLVQSKNSFRLMAKTTGEYKVILKQVSMKVCKLYLEPSMINAHAESIKSNPAIYSFMEANIKTFSIAKGSYNIKFDDLFQGKVPSRLVCGIVRSDSYSGSYALNPFNFQNCAIDSFTCLADNQALPFNGINTKFSANNYQEAYNALFTGTELNLSNAGNDITREDFKSGYTLFVFDLDAHSRSLDSKPALRNGNLSLEIKLGTALPWAATLICYARFPAQIMIDNARAVIV